MIKVESNIVFRLGSSADPGRGIYMKCVNQNNILKW